MRHQEQTVERVAEFYRDLTELPNWDMEPMFRLLDRATSPRWCSYRRAIEVCATLCLVTFSNAPRSGLKW